MNFGARVSPEMFLVSCVLKCSLKWAQTLSFHLVSMGSLQSTWKARGEDSDSYLFILSTFE